MDTDNDVREVLILLGNQAKAKSGEPNIVNQAIVAMDAYLSVLNAICSCGVEGKKLAFDIAEVFQTNLHELLNGK